MPQCLLTQGTALDALHDDAVSWAVTDETQLREALAVSLSGLRDVTRLSARTSNMLRAGTEQPGTYHVRLVLDRIKICHDSCWNLLGV